MLLKTQRSQFMPHSQLQNCYIQAFKASHASHFTTAGQIIYHVRITLVRSHMNLSAIEEIYSNQTTFNLLRVPGHEDTKQAWRARCQILGILTLEEVVQHTIFFDILQFVKAILISIGRYRFLPSTSLYSTHIFCNMQCNMYLNRKKQILTLDEVVQHTFIKQHVTVFAI